MLQLWPTLEPKEFPGYVGAATVAERAIGKRPGGLPCRIDEALPGLMGRPLADEEDQGCVHQVSNGSEILHGIKRQFHQRGGESHIRAQANDPLVSIGLGSYGFPESQSAGCAWAILNHDGPARVVLELRAEQTRDDVCARSGR